MPACKRKLWLSDWLQGAANAYTHMTLANANKCLLYCGLSSCIVEPTIAGSYIFCLKEIAVRELSTSRLDLVEFQLNFC